MGYPRWQTAGQTLPHVERAKAARDRQQPRAPLRSDPAGRTVYRLARDPASRHGDVSERIAEGLDPQQLAAVQGATGRTLILAAAGSGKTRTLVATLANLVAHGVSAREIVLVTFTRRAAREMVLRAQDACGTDLSGVMAGTFHSICHRMLREHGAAIGLPPDFSVLDPEDQADLITMVRDRLLADLTVRPSLPKPATLAGYFSLAAESERPIAEVVVEQNGRLADRVELITRIAAAYADLKARISGCDYADLLVGARDLLASYPAVAQKLRRRYRWVLVDELHDTNAIQADLVELLGAEGNIVAVADPDQAIYSWRGADPKVVERLAARSDVRTFKLETNYRSTPEIVAMAQEVLPNGNRWERRLRAARPGSGVRPVVAHLASVADEAAFVTQRIADVLNEGREPGDIGVLYRAHHHSVDLQLALTAAGVEFELYSGARFVESAHVKDVLAFCRIRHNPRDELAWRRALRLFPGVGAATVATLWDAVCAEEDPFSAIDAAAERGSRPAVRAAAAIAEIAGTSQPDEIVLLVARSEWYRDHLERSYPNWRDREGDLARLAELAARAQDLGGFLADLQLAERVEADEDVSGPARRVALSTVHQAKGLEWPVVFILQVEPGSFPSSWAVSEGTLEEEERLFYVATTRAADELYYCRPIEARRPWDTGANAVVINSGYGFLDREMDALVDEWSVR
ncbi:MAG: ATP-dependent helicase [Thermoleophilia bacterium]|nr:ATP-dependent helicase [Thermoleophilia bacterium]